jgi:hypothetical protein
MSGRVTTFGVKQTEPSCCTNPLNVARAFYQLLDRMSEAFEIQGANAAGWRSIKREVVGQHRGHTEYAVT